MMVNSFGEGQQERADAETLIRWMVSVSSMLVQVVASAGGELNHNVAVKETARRCNTTVKHVRRVVVYAIHNNVLTLNSATKILSTS